MNTLRGASGFFRFAEGGRVGSGLHRVCRLMLCRRSNNAAVDRVGGLSGLRAHMEEQTI